MRQLALTDSESDSDRDWQVRVLTASGTRPCQ